MLDQILEVSRNMLALAEQGEWEQVDILQQERQIIVEQTFPLEDDAARNPNVATVLKQILMLDGQIQGLAEKRHREIGQELGRINQGRAVTKAYKTTSRS